VTIVEAAGRGPAGSMEVAVWSVAVVVVGAVPGLGLVAGIVLAATRLRDNRVARVLVPVLGAAATLLWALGVLAPFGGADVGPASPA
jgi:hypothetical protein